MSSTEDKGSGNAETEGTPGIVVYGATGLVGGRVGRVQQPRALRRLPQELGARALAQLLRREDFACRIEGDAVDSGDHRCLIGGGTALGWPGSVRPSGTLSRRERTTW